MPRVIAEVDVIKRKPYVTSVKDGNDAAKQYGFKASKDAREGKASGGVPVIVVPQQPKKTKYKEATVYRGKIEDGRAIVVVKEKAPVKRAPRAVPKAAPSPEPEKKAEALPKVIVAGSRLKEAQYAKVRKELNDISKEIGVLRVVPKFSALSDWLHYKRKIEVEKNKLFLIRRDLLENHGFKDEDEEITKITKLIAECSRIVNENEEIFDKKVQEKREYIKKNVTPGDRKSEHYEEKIIRRGRKAAEREELGGTF